MNRDVAPVIGPDGMQGAVTPEWANRNPFRSLSFSDAFGDGVELTAAIQRTPYNPGQIAKMKIFTDPGVETLRSNRKKPKSTS